MRRFTPRPLTEQERQLLDRLLAADIDHAELYRAQLDAVTVVGRCGCGCPTIELAVDPARARRAPTAGADDAFALEVEGNGPNGEWLLVHVRGGYLSELEAVPPQGHGGTLPDADGLKVELQ